MSSTPAATSTTAATSSTSQSTSSTSSSSTTTTTPPTSTSTSSPASAPAGSVQGTGYTFSGPAGFTERNNVPKVDRFIIDPADKDGFADNVNVVRIPGQGDVSLTAIEAAAQNELKSAGATNIKVLPRTQLGGQEAARASADAKVGTIAYAVEQVYVVRGGAAYSVTFSFSPTATQQRRSEVINPVMSSWKWTS